jgi:hypothetical protein
MGIFANPPGFYAIGLLARNFVDPSLYLVENKPTAERSQKFPRSRGD